jgi:hypothetical protein
MSANNERDDESREHNNTANETNDGGESALLVPAVAIS